MSKQELSRLKNKFKLYLALHHDFKRDEQSHYCGKYCALRKNEITCGHMITLMYNFSNGKCYNTVKGIPISGFCIEWIKNV